ncbi:hypothetical protein SAY86_015489 [Trapa natans]|uniref:Mevalonate kinase n=1 Tax=Trapa natans TaxID=22666 RepID=A0AAN7LJT7_TRANT|nr:hypothetical protein SAY86_015489 [Trapa natans]
MEVTARAPGKIILSGEHGVVHGSTAVASSIGLYTSVTIHFPSQNENDGNLKLRLRDLSLEFSWSISHIQECLKESNKADCLKPSAPAAYLSNLQALVEEQHIPEAKFGLASGIKAFLWLYTCIQGYGFPVCLLLDPLSLILAEFLQLVSLFIRYKPATVSVSSELPMSSGLGSSAAYCVALSAAFLSFSSATKLDVGKQGWQEFEDDELKLLNGWAFEGEKIIHGKPSGIDNTASTYGNMIKFKSGNLTPFTSSLPLRMLITNTKVGRNTKALVAGVSERTKRHYEAMACVFSAVDSISTELSEIIKAPAPNDIAITEFEEKIEELMEMNQGLLQCMGVSHASIETVLRTTLKYKLTSKLTGAGGGGCVITLLPTCILELIFFIWIHFNLYHYLPFSLNPPSNGEKLSHFDR